MAILGSGGSTLSTALARAASDLRFFKDLKASIDIKRIELCFLRGVIDKNPLTPGLPINKETTAINETEVALANLKQFSKEHFGIKEEEFDKKLYVPPYDFSESQVEEYEKKQGDPEGKYNVQRELMRIQSMIYGLDLDIDNKKREVDRLQATLEDEGKKL